jgi:ketosteroid isomerase-like protein
VAGAPASRVAGVSDLEGLARRFFGAFGRDDAGEVMRNAMTEDAVSWITNAEGGSDRVEGREGWIARVPSLEGAEGRVDVVQVVAVDADHMLTMIEVHAARKGRTLHNFAAFLTRVQDDRIAELWMVDAKPAESDAFWSA